MKNILAYVFSDIHIHKWKRFNGDNKRLKEHIKFVEFLWHKAIKAECPIIFGGDFVHDGENLNPQMLDALIDLFRRLPKGKNTKIYGIPGNHDMDNFTNTLDNPATNAYAILAKLFPDILVDISLTYNVIPTKWGNMGLYGIPYLRNNYGMEKLLEKSTLKQKGYSKENLNILVIHTVLPGVKDTTGIKMAEEGLSIKSVLTSDKFNLTLCGHIHAHQEVVENIFSIGSPLQQRVSDMGSSMGYMVIYVNKPNILSKRAIIPEFKKYHGPEFKYTTNIDSPPDDYNFWVKTPEDNHIPDIPKIEAGSTADKGAIEPLVKSYMTYTHNKNRVREKHLISLLKDSL